MPLEGLLIADHISSHSLNVNPQALTNRPLLLVAVGSYSTGNI
jgi:hypothetical protein